MFIKMELSVQSRLGVYLNVCIINFHGVPQIHVLIAAALLIGTAGEQREADQNIGQNHHKFLALQG